MEPGEGPLRRLVPPERASLGLLFCYCWTSTTATRQQTSTFGKMDTRTQTPARPARGHNDADNMANENEGISHIGQVTTRTDSSNNGRTVNPTSGRRRRPPGSRTFHGSPRAVSDFQPGLLDPGAALSCVLCPVFNPSLDNGACFPALRRRSYS